MLSQDLLYAFEDNHSHCTPRVEHDHDYVNGITDENNIFEVRYISKYTSFLYSLVNILFFFKGQAGEV